MKKFSCFILSVVFLFGLCVVAFGQDITDEHFTIKIPDNFSKVGEYEFIDSNNSDIAFNVTIEENEDNECIEDKSKKTIDEDTKEITETAKKMFQVYGKEAEMVCLSCKKVKHPNGMTAIARSFKTTCELSQGKETRYQKMLFFTGAVNTYTFSYDVKDKKDLDNFDKAFDTIEINEVEARSIKDKVLIYCALALIIFLIAFGIYKFVSSPNNRQEELSREKKDKANKDVKKEE